MSLENIFKNHKEPKLQNVCITTHITSTKFIFNYIYWFFFVYNFQKKKIKWFVWLNNTVIYSNFHFNIYSIVMSKRHHLHYIWRLRMFKCWRAKSEQEHPGGIHIFHLERHPREHIIAFSPSYWHSWQHFLCSFSYVRAWLCCKRWQMSHTLTGTARCTGVPWEGCGPLI